MMQKISPLLCLLGLFSKTFCYFTLIQERKTWSEARSYCKSYHTDLATIQSDEDRYKIQEIANAISFSHRAWMGLNDGVMAWRWSYRDLNTDYMNWASGEDTSSRTQRKCGVITVTGSWHVASCEEQKPSFCYNGKSLEGSFVFIDALLTWRDAQLYCTRKHVDLAIISDASENSALLQLFPPKPSQPEAWIGLSKNLWLWSDQSKVSWTSFKWAEGEPDNGEGNEKCGFVRQTGLIGDEDCSHQLPFYCTKRVNIQLLRLRLRSAGRLDESAVKQAIKEKMDQILSDQQTSETRRVQIFMQRREPNAPNTTSCGH